MIRVVAAVARYIAEREERARGDDRVQSTEIISLEAIYFSYIGNLAIITNAKDT